jgi:4-amino-4-deoxy-L-arabinose transferase-like glycosyltransferase
MPFTWEMLYTIALGIGDTATGKALHFAASVLCSLVAFALGSRLHSRLAGLVAGTVFFLTPIVVWESTTADNDLGLAFFEGLSVLAVFAWLQHRDRRWLILAGLLAGIALGIKLTGAYLVLAGTGVLIAWWWRCDRSLATLRELSWLGVAIAPFAPWLVRSAILTGNPVFPIGEPSLFPVLGPLAGTWRDFLSTHYGLGHSPAQYLALPWSVTFRGDAFEGTPGPLYLAFVPALLFLAPRVRAAGLLMLFVAWLAVWALGSQQMRFLIPGLLLAAPAVGVSLATILGSASRPMRAAGVGAAIAAFCLCGLNLPSFGRLWQASPPPVVFDVPWRSLSAIASGAPLQDELEQLFPTLKTVAFINTRLPPEARLYALEGGIPNLYVDRVVINLDEPIGEGLELRDIFERQDGAERLKSFGIRYVYTNGTRRALVENAPWGNQTCVIYHGNGDEAIFAVDTVGA